MENPIPVNDPEAETGDELEQVTQMMPPSVHASELPGAVVPPGRPAEADHLCALALILFDQTRSLHALGDDGRRIMEQVALLLRQPFPRGRKKPQRAALEFVKSHLAGEFSDQEYNVIATTLAVCHHRLKKKELKRLDLLPAQARQVLTIASLLQIAAGIDRPADGSTNIREIVLAPEGILIVLEGPLAATAAQVAQHNARMWSRIGYPTVKAMEVDDAAIWQQPFPESIKRTGVAADDTLAEAGRKVMLYHFAQMLRWEDGTRLGEDIEALHRMRVATRRLRAAFEVFESAFEPGALKPHLKGLRATGRCLGRVRDLDVFIEKAQHYRETLPRDRHDGLSPLLDAWQEQRQAGRNAMLSFMDSPEYALFKRQFNIFLNTPGAGARQTSGDQPTPLHVRELVPVLIYTRMAAVRAYQPFLHDAPVELLHALRIEFKKLRYTVEYFDEVLGKRSMLVIENLKALQDHLGDLNDAQVATQMLAAFIEDWDNRQMGLPIHDRQSIEEVVNYLAYRHAERHHLMSTFSDVWRQQFSNSKFRRNLASSLAVL